MEEAEIISSQNSALTGAEPSKNTSTSINAKKFILEGPPPGPLEKSISLYFPDVEFRPVHDVEELEQASRIVYDEYRKLGYIRPNSNGWKLSLHQTIPTTVTFVAKHRINGIIGTSTLVEDSPLGLPMDNLFNIELNELRSHGRRLCEYTMLAMDKEAMDKNGCSLSHSERLLLLLHLFRAMCDYSRQERGIDTQIECCHPTHDSFYKLMGLQAFGEMKYHKGVNGHPAVARIALFEKAAAEGSKNAYFRLFLGELPPAAPRERLKFSSADLHRYFIQHSNILSSASPQKLDHIKKYYPDYNLDDLIKSKHVLTHLIEALDNKSYLGYAETGSDKK